MPTHRDRVVGDRCVRDAGARARPRVRRGAAIGRRSREEERGRLRHRLAARRVLDRHRSRPRRARLLLLERRPQRSALQHHAVLAARVPAGVRVDARRAIPLARLRRAAHLRLAVSHSQPADLSAQHQRKLLRPRRRLARAAAVHGLRAILEVRRVRGVAAASRQRHDVRQVRSVRPVAADLDREHRAAVLPRSRARARRHRLLVRARQGLHRPERRRRRRRRQQRASRREPDAARARLCERHRRRLQRRPRRLLALRRVLRHARLRARSQHRHLPRRRARSRHGAARLAVRLRALHGRRARLLLADSRDGGSRARRSRGVPSAVVRHAVLQHGFISVHRRSAQRPRRPSHAARLSRRSLRRAQ